MREKIEARNGMIITNGEIYGRTIFLGSNFKKEDFYEITIEEYQTIKDKEKEKQK